jgi:hypothetical protein
MFAAMVLDPRLAFVFLCMLVVGAAVPLAIGWARVLPEDEPPFASPEGSSQGSRSEVSTEKTKTRKHNTFAIVLLAIVTFSYVLQFPGLRGDAALHWLAARMPETWLIWMVLAGRAFFVVTPGLAACYSVVQPNSLRGPLISSGILVLLLWLLQPMLFAAMTAW